MSLCVYDCTNACLSPAVLACLGFLSPANRGALMTCAVVLWVLLGTPAGYVSARLYKSKGVGKMLSQSQNWCCHLLFDPKMIASSSCVLSFWRREVEDKRVADSTFVPRVSLVWFICWIYKLIYLSTLALIKRAVAFTRVCVLNLPLLKFKPHIVISLSFVNLFYRIVFADFFLMNLILWVEGSSAAIPFGTLVAILAMWFGISVPLTFVGAYFGFKKAVSQT